MMLCGAMAAYGFGCTQTRIYSPEHLYDGSEEDITVVMKDGRMIQFRSGDYAVLGTEGGAIRGTGQLVIDKDRKTYRWFQGTISFAEIQKVTTTHTTTVGTVGFIALIASIGILARLILFPPVHME
jgi:hypothetical protein